LTAIRRVARVKKSAEAMAVHPGRSLPKLGRSPSAVKAPDNLCTHEDATPEPLQSGPRAVVRAALRPPGVSLFLADTPAWSWSGQPPMAGLGPIGKSAAGLQGFFVHTGRRGGWPATPQDNRKRQPVEVLG
jgi:hypothetical protein